MRQRPFRSRRDGLKRINYYYDYDFNQSQSQRRDYKSHLRRNTTREIDRRSQTLRERDRDRAKRISTSPLSTHYSDNDRNDNVDQDLEHDTKRKGLLQHSQDSSKNGDTPRPLTTSHTLNKNEKDKDGTNSNDDSPKLVRFEPQDSDATVSDESCSEPERLTSQQFSNRTAADISEDDIVIGGKALRKTKARRNYTQEYSDYDDYSVRYQHRLRLRRKEPINYSKQLMPPNFTQILDKESLDIETGLNANDEFHQGQEDSRQRFFVSNINSSSSRPISKKNNNMHEQRLPLNDSDDEEVPILKKGRIFGLLRASEMQNSKNHQNLPVNLKEMMQAEELRLLQRVDNTTKESFLKVRVRDSFASNDLNTVSHVQFSHVSGFDEHIISLKEMFAIPLMYPEIFRHLSITAPKGVLFHGPPGTGKTMMARALANSCSSSGRPVAFFMRKGADILNKWVGESEKQLRVLFEQAKAWQPSIIFFDEIDGLAPIRSSKQDQIHASVVSTLLSLMDGLDDRGQVVVIGATNRIDAIDPALRRPGRFDREFYFGFPNEQARRKIIENTTKSWTRALDSEELDRLAVMTKGYNGADVKALCTESALHAVRRTFPHIYTDAGRFKINVHDIKVLPFDFNECMTKLTPSTERSSLSFGIPLPQHLVPLLDTHLSEISLWLTLRIVPILKQTQRIKPVSSTSTTFGPLHLQDYLKSFSPRLFIYGPPNGQDLLGSALVEVLEQLKFYVKTIDITRFISSDSFSESLILNSFCELKRHRFAALYLPNLDAWWETASDSTRIAFLNICDQSRHSSFLIVITAAWDRQDVPQELEFLLPRDNKTSFWRKSVAIGPPNETSRKVFIQNLLADFQRGPDTINLAPPGLSLGAPELAEGSDKTPFFEASQMQDLLQEFEAHKRRTRQVLSCINDNLRKSFRTFAKRIDSTVISHFEPEKEMDLSIIDEKIHENKYELPSDFIADIEMIEHNVSLFCNPRMPNERDLLTKVRKLVDAANEHVQTLTCEFMQHCWYFYLFKRSGLINVDTESTVQSDNNSAKRADSIATGMECPFGTDIQDKDDQSAFEELLEETEMVCSEDGFDKPMAPVARNGLFQATVVRSLSQEEEDSLVDYLVSATTDYSLSQLEDLGVSLAASILENQDKFSFTLLMELSQELCT